MINWKQKLSSRKFWAAIAGLAAAIMTAVRLPEDTAAQVTAIIAAVADVAVYMISESMVDVSRSTKNEEK